MKTTQTDRIFRVELICEPDALDQVTFGGFWNALRDPPVQTETFGAYATQYPFDPDPLRAFDMLRHELSIAGSGLAERVSWTLDLRRLLFFKAWLQVEHDDAQLGRWSQEVFQRLPAIYGFACSVREFDAHHRHDEMTERGGIVSGDVGTTVEFPASLPGIYWMTFFGAELTAGLPLEQLDAMPSVRRETLGEGKTAVALEGPPFVDDVAARLSLSRQVATRLGDDYFYDRDRPQRALATVPTLLPLRERLEAGS